MFRLRLKCDVCPFETDDSPWGPADIGSPPPSSQAVYLPREGRLVHFQIDVSHLGNDPTRIDEWLSKNAPRIIAERYGPDAVKITLEDPKKSWGPCPKCKVGSLRVVFTGIS